MGGDTNATKVIGAPYRRRPSRADAGPTAKEAVNAWLVHALREALAAIPPSSSTPAPPPWALVLDTELCSTVRALDAAGAIPAARCVVPNPDARVVAACAELGAVGLACTSHAVLVPEGPEHPALAARRTSLERRASSSSSSSAAAAGAAAAIPGAPLVSLPAACRGAIAFAWLDYCGGISSRAGRRRREDVRALLASRTSRSGSGAASSASAEDASNAAEDATPWLAPVAVLALTLADRGAPALYDGDAADQAVCFVADAARRGGRVADVVGAVSYGGLPGAPPRDGSDANAHARARMQTLAFLVTTDDSTTGGGDGSTPGRRVRVVSAATRASEAFFKNALDDKKTTDEEAAPLRFSSGWTLRLGDGEAGPRGRDAETQRRVADVFAAAVAERAADVSPAASTPPPLALALDSRLLPAALALRRVAPRVAVRVAVEDDLDRLVASEAARRAGLVAAGDQHPRARRETDGVAIEIETNARDLLDASASRASSGVVVGAFLDFTPRHRAFSRAEVAACGSWPHLNAALRAMRRRGGGGRRAGGGGAIRGVLAVLVNVSDDVEYWDGLAIDLLLAGVREAANRVANEGDPNEENETNETSAEFETSRVRGQRASVSARVEALAERRTVSGRVPRASLVAEVTFFSDSKSAEDSNHLRVGPTRPVVWDEARPKAPRGRLGAALLAWATEALHHRREAAAGSCSSDDDDASDASNPPSDASDASNPKRRRRAFVVVEPGGCHVVPALLASGRGTVVHEVACDDAHRAESLRRVGDAANADVDVDVDVDEKNFRLPRPGGGEEEGRRRRRALGRRVAHASPGAAAEAMGATSFRRKTGAALPTMMSGRASDEGDASFDSRGARARRRRCFASRPCTTRGRGASSGARSSPRGRRWRGGAWRRRRRRGFEDRATRTGRGPVPRFVVVLPEVEVEVFPPGRVPEKTPPARRRRAGCFSWTAGAGTRARSRRRSRTSRLRSGTRSRRRRRGA
jgi:hypothetical protein